MTGLGNNRGYPNLLKAYCLYNHLCNHIGYGIHRMNQVDQEGPMKCRAQRKPAQVVGNPHWLQRCGMFARMSAPMSAHMCDWLLNPSRLFGFPLAVLDCIHVRLDPEWKPTSSALGWQLCQDHVQLFAMTKLCWQLKCPCPLMACAVRRDEIPKTAAFVTPVAAAVHMTGNCRSRCISNISNIF